MTLFHRMGLSIKVTSECQQICSWCPVKPWMNANPGYHLSMKNVNDLIKYSKESGYHWQFIMFSGGEPMLWKNIVPAAKAINESGITDGIISYTNAMTADKDLEKIKAVAENVSMIKISVYDYNDDQVRKLCVEIPEKVRLINRAYFNTIPDDPIPDSLPAECACSAYGMIGNRITLCSFMEFMVGYKGWDIKDFSESFTTLKPNFLDDLKDKNPFRQQMCAYCFGNNKVAAKCEKIENKAFWISKR